VILLNATTRRGPDGTVTGVVGVGQDITEIRDMGAEMARVADDLQRLIETANAPIFGVDTEGNVTEWNSKAAAISGFSKDETMGQSLVERFITEDYRESVGDVLQKAMAGDETANFEFPLFTKDGRRLTILLNATTRRGPDGAVTGVVGVVQDITDIRDMAAEMGRVADDLQRLIETANAPIFGVDTEGKVTEWNSKAAAISGFSKTRPWVSL
jgi:PAS domain S-box-containing protein